jgi:PAS domain-containing protein
MTLTRDDFNEVARDAGGVLHRVFGLRIARSAARIGEWAEHGTRSLLWRIPLSAAGRDERHEIIFYDPVAEQIVGVEGTRWTARNNNHAVVERPAPGSAAALAVRTPIAGKFQAGLPPLPFELREGEGGLWQEMFQVR